MNLTKNIFLLLFTFVSLNLVAKTYKLDLQQSIDLAKQKSLDMKALNENLDIAEYSMKAATNALRTHVDLSLKIPEFTQTIRQYEDTAGLSFYSVKQLSSKATLTINQPLITDGNLYVRSYISDLDDYDGDNRLMNLNTRIGFSQPLDAFYGYNNTSSTLKQAKLDYEKSKKSLARSELNLKYNVSSAFYNLMSVKKLEEIALMNLERQQDAYNIAKNKFKAGLIKEVDALQMEVDLASTQNSYDLAIINTKSALNKFIDVVGLEFTDSIIIDTKMNYKTILVDPDMAVEYAMKNRLEIREAEISYELSKMSLKKQKANGMISSSINAYFEKAGVSKRDLDGMDYGSSLNDSYNDLKNRPENYGVGLTVNIPIIDWGENKAKVKAAEARLKKSKINEEQTQRSIRREVIDLVNKVNSSLKRLQLLTKSVVVAEKSFNITLDRYQDGDIDSQSLALERNRLNTAYVSQLNAFINYQLTLEDLTRKTFYDFKKNKAIF